MGRAKEIIVKVIPSKVANEFVKKTHYSGRTVNTSKLHFGCFLDGKLHGAMSYGPPMIKKNMLGMVKGTGWNEMLELNRMAFDDYLPKYSESRCIAISIRLIKKHAPHIKWILSFSDGTQCGDGTIYRASGFLLTGIKENKQLRINPDTGEPIQSMAAYHLGKSRQFKDWKKLQGFQLRYIYLIDKNAKLNCKSIPFSEIEKAGAKMYKGKKENGA